MGAGKRSIWATLGAAWSYFMYIYLPGYLFQFAQSDYSFSGATIALGDVATLETYIVSLGWIIVGLSFASGMAAKKTTLKTVWEFLRLFAAIVFLGLFIATGFNTIDVNAALSDSIALNLDLVITRVFYVAMGAKIFSLIILVLDFGISFIDEEDEEDDGFKEDADFYDEDLGEEEF